MRKTFVNRVLTLACPAVNLLIGVALLTIPELAMRWVCPVLTVAMLLVGVAQIVSYLTTPADKNVDHNGFGIGTLLLILAIFVLLWQNQVLQAIPFLLGSMIALNGVRELQNGVDVVRLRIPRGWIVVLVALLNLILGEVLMFDPFGMSSAALTLALGIGLVVSGCADLVSTLVIYAKSRERTDADKTTPGQNL